MHLQATIVVGQTNDQVWRFFSNASNLARWDRSVAQVILTSPEPFGVGSTFDTIAPVPKSHALKEGLRMSYRVTSYVPNQQMNMQLTNSSMFKYAEWIMTTEDISEGVRITCQLDGTLRFQYSFLLPILLLTYKGAFRRDLTYLKQAIKRDAMAQQCSIAHDESRSSSL
ncbi:MAG TPA: SRPBCC family protein [Ktedonobacteraceae bacterium]|nr:SRPBCC family protein [Ktedonobacteraceae bacterium]